MKYDLEIIKDFIATKKAYELLEADKVATDKQIEHIKALADKIDGTLAQHLLHKDHFKELIIQSEDVLKTAYGTHTIDKIGATYFIDKNGKFYNVKIADLIKVLNGLLKADAELKKDIKEFEKEQAKQEK